MLEAFWLNMAAWWETVTSEFAFMLALPLAVAVVACVGECVRHCRSGRSAEP
jgi:hypothetical protein